MTQIQQNPVWYGKDIVLYDGVCGLCNRFVQFVLKHDHAEPFYFAALQSPFAQEMLARHGQDGALLNTVVLVRAAGTERENLLFRSDAATAICLQLGGIWSILARLLYFLPGGLRDAGYWLVARYRYRIFGQYDACPPPKPGWQDRFLG